MLSSDVQKYVDALMLEIRKLVVSIHDEQRDLLEQLQEFPEPLMLASATHARSTAVKSSSSNTNSNTNSGSTSEPPSEDPNSNSTALSSSIATTNGSSTKPPSYKTAINKTTNDQQQAPRPPLRLKKGSSLTLTRSTQRPSITSEAAAALARLNRISTTNPRTMSSTPSAAVSRGALIVLEGLDRVGKSTLAKNLAEHLQRISTPVATCRFPERSTKVGQVIDDLLKNSTKPVDDHVMHLLFSANRWEMNKSIRNTLLKGTTVVVDRYAYSGMAYSSAKRLLSIDWCRNTERGLPKPDLIIYLELTKESQYSRPGFGEERFETRDFQEQIRQQYEQVIKTSNENWLRIDVTNKSPDEVLGEIVLPVRQCLETSANKELEDID